MVAWDRRDLPWRASERARPALTPWSRGSLAIPYDPGRDRAGRRDPRRRAGHADALRDAEAAAPAVRAADDRLVGGRGAGGRRRQGGRRRGSRASRSRRRWTSEVEFAVQERAARAPPTRSRRRRGTSAAHDTVIVLNGDHPLIRPETIPELGAGARPLRRRRDDRDRGARRPDRLRAGRPGAGRNRRAGRRDQGARRRHRARAPHPRGQHRRLRVRGRGELLAALERGSQRQRPGRAVPARRAADPPLATSGPCSRTRSTTPSRRSASTTGSSSRAVTGARPAADQRAPHARRGRRSSTRRRR